MFSNEVLQPQAAEEHIEQLAELAKNDDVLKEHLRKVQEAWNEDDEDVSEAA